MDYAAGDLPDYADTDHLKTRSTRLIATAMLVARDGDDALLDKHEAWVRAVLAKAIEEEIDPHSSSKMLQYNRPGMGICALIHLWHRRLVPTDRNRLVEAAARTDRAGVPAFAAALPRLNETDPRLLKSAIRIAFACRRWRWHSYDENPAEGARYEAKKIRRDGEAVAAEIAWLDGGAEPSWPVLPEETPYLRNRHRQRLSTHGEGIDVDRDDDAWVPRSKKSSVHVDTQGIAKWLSLLNADIKATPGWYQELIEVYALWSARLNGHGCLPDAELDRTPDDWNYQFYVLYAAKLMDADGGLSERHLKSVVELPDRSFCDVVDTLVHAADVLYFNNRSRPPHRARDLRGRLVARMIELQKWSRDNPLGDLRFGSAIAKLLMNSYNPFASTECYLVPAVFDRLDPLIDTSRPLLRAGPTPFIAICTMNSLSVAPISRHLDFLLFAVETWLDVVRDD